MYVRTQTLNECLNIINLSPDKPRQEYFLEETFKNVILGREQISSFIRLCQKTRALLA